MRPASIDRRVRPREGLRDDGLGAATIRGRVTLLSALCLASGCLAGCGGQTPRGASQVFYELSPATWFEDGFSSFDVAPAGDRAVFRGRYGPLLIDLEQRREAPQRAAGGLDEVRWAVFDNQGALVLAGRRGDQVGWFADDDAGPRSLPLPPEGLPSWSPDGTAVALAVGSDIRIGQTDDLRAIQLPGAVTGLGWGPDSEALFALVSGQDGSSAIIRVSTDGGTRIVRDGLDAVQGLDRIAVSSDGLLVYVALASDGPPDDEARHTPTTDRDTDIYALELTTGRLRAVVTDPGDDFYPTVAVGYLYWTHNEMRDQVVVVPIEGGDARVAVEDAQIPYWSSDGRRLSFTVGEWRIADWALNLDAAAVDVDAEGRPTGPPMPIVTGYHEDFTPVWSPDGKWIAYHSHRSAGPVPAYAAESSTDDIYLRSTTPGSREIRLTDFGWEVGNPSWAPDSRRLVFDSQDRGGASFLSKAWIVHIDPETGQPQDVHELPTPDGAPGFKVLSWSPVADEIGLTYPVGPGRFVLALLTPDGAPPRRLTEFEASTAGGISWTPDGRRIVYSALAEGRMQLFAIDPSSSQSSRLTSDASSLILPQVSPDGRWIAATRLLRAKQLRRLRLP